MFDKKLDKLLPLLPNTELINRVIFEKQVEGTGQETHEVSQKHPDILMDNKFILEYTNVKGTKFYTVFDRSKDEAYRNQFFKQLKR